MVIDTSAVVAILLAEPEQEVFTDLIASGATRAISAIGFYEAGLVMAGKKQTSSAAQLVDDFIRDLAISVAAVTSEELIAARQAYFEFGRGFHPAGLNFGDCFSYALAKARGEPLLFKGDDFAKTDIVPAWRP